MRIFVPFFAIVLVVAGQHGNHGNHGNHGGGGEVPGSGQVDAAIVNIELHYNDKLCLELLLVDCSKHVTQGDEQVCGTDGVTYVNHCLFAHAMCEFAYSDNALKLANHGACSAITTTAAPPASTMAPVATAAPATGSMGMTTNGASATTTTTTVIMTTTTAAATTPDPIHSIVQNVFCQNTAVISCANDFQIICGSDGQLYPNQCEMSKQKCVDPTLTVAEKSTCPLPGR